MAETKSSAGKLLTEQVIGEVRKAVVGKDLTLVKVMIAFLCGGHVLMEDMPGVGKTTLALAFSKALGLSCRRVQFTPDVLPSDLTGFSIYRKGSEEFVFEPGALFCNLLLADEINRTSSKTQAALLEAMEEGNVTVEGTTYELPKPHLVIATQNPLGSVGTQALPESQLDRFFMRLHMGYPQLREEVAILRDRARHNPLNDIVPVCDAQRLLGIQREVSAVYVDDRLYFYCATIAKATREHPRIVLGVSPRGTLALISAAKAKAYLAGRDYVLPDDIVSLSADVLSHRLIVTGGVIAQDLLDEIVRSTPIPAAERR